MDTAGGVPQRDDYDVVVIGSGAGGICAAAILAKSGLRVLLAEQWETPGGYAHAFHRDQYTIDPAVHLIGDEGLYRSLLRHLDVPDRCRFIVPDEFFGAAFPDFMLHAPLTSVDRFIEAHAEVVPAAAVEIREFFQLCAALHQEAHDLPAEVAFGDLAEALERFPTVFAYRRAMLDEVAADTISDPRARQACSAAALVLGVPPSRMPFQLFAQFVMSYLVDGGFFCEGGAQNLADAIIEGLTLAEGELVLRARVTGIMTEGGRVTGVRIGDQEVTAPVVVSNASAVLTYEELIGPELLPAAFVRTLRRLQPSVSGFVAFGATTADLVAAGVDHTNLTVPTGDLEEGYQLSFEGKAKGGFGFWVPSLADPTLAPPGEHVFTAVAYRPYDIGVPWSDERERFGAIVLDELERQLPGLREGLVFADSATPVTLERFTLNTGGAIFGWENTLPHLGSKRPAQRGELPGLYLAGHWTRPGPGFLRASVSGIHTAQMVLADLDIHAAPFEHASLPPVA